MPMTTISVAAEYKLLNKLVLKLFYKILLILGTGIIAISILT